MVGLGITWSSQTSQTSPHGQIQKASLSKDYETEMEAFLNDPFARKYEKFVAHLRKNYFGKNGACMLEMI